MTIEIDKSMDPNFVYEVLITYRYEKGMTIDFQTTINLHQTDVSVQRGIKKLKLENVTKVTIKPLQQLSTVNYKK